MADRDHGRPAGTELPPPPAQDSAAAELTGGEPGSRAAGPGGDAAGDGVFRWPSSGLPRVFGQPPAGDEAVPQQERGSGPGNGSPPQAGAGPGPARPGAAGQPPGAAGAASWRDVPFPPRLTLAPQAPYPEPPSPPGAYPLADDFDAIDDYDAADAYGPPDGYEAGYGGFAGSMGPDLPAALEGPVGGPAGEFAGDGAGQPAAPASPGAAPASAAAPAPPAPAPPAPAPAAPVPPAGTGWPEAGTPGPAGAGEAGRPMAEEPPAAAGAAGPAESHAAEPAADGWPAGPEAAVRGPDGAGPAGAPPASPAAARLPAAVPPLPPAPQPAAASAPQPAPASAPQPAAAPGPTPPPRDPAPSPHPVPQPAAAPPVDPTPAPDSAPRPAATPAGPPGERQPPPVAQTADSLTADLLLPGRRPPPSEGWRRLLYRSTGGLVRAPESAAEQRRRQLVARARTPVAGGHHRVAVLSLKGGVGKTTTTVGLGATLASLRGDRVIAVDANPDRGTLSDKLRLETAATVRDLLNERAQVQRYADVRAFTTQAPSRLEVLASDRDPTVSVAFSEADYADVAAVLEHYYSICLTDCGTGLLHSAMAGVLRLADQIVLVSSPSVDGARSASATLDWLTAHDYGGLVRGGVVVLSAVRPRGKSTVDMARLEEHFAARCRAVVRVPYDPHLAEGAELELGQLSKQTADAYLALAAEVGDGFARRRNTRPASA